MSQWCKCKETFQNNFPHACKFLMTVFSAVFQEEWRLETTEKGGRFIAHLLLKCFNCNEHKRLRNEKISWQCDITTSSLKPLQWFCPERTDVHRPHSTLWKGDVFTHVCVFVCLSVTITQYTQWWNWLALDHLTTWTCSNLFTSDLGKQAFN